MRHSERFVVRAKHNRKLNEIDNKLFDFMSDQDLIGSHLIDIPKKE